MARLWPELSREDVIDLLDFINDQEIMQKMGMGLSTMCGIHDYTVRYFRRRLDELNSNLRDRDGRGLQISRDSEFHRAWLVEK